VYVRITLKKQNYNQKIRRIMKTKIILKIEFSILALLSLFFVISCTSSAKENDSPNIILFLVDDMGLMDTSVQFFNRCRWQSSQISAKQILSDS